MTKTLSLLLAGIVAASLATSTWAQGAGPKGGAKPPQQGGKLGQPGQGKGGPGMRMGKMYGELMGKLDLSAAQKSRIAAIDAKHKDSMQKLMQAPGERDQKMTKFRELSQKHRSDVQAVLTPAQKAQFERLMKEAREKFRQNRGDPGAPGKAGKGNPPPGKGTPPPGKGTPPPA